MKRSLLTFTFIGLLAVAAGCGDRDYLTSDDPLAEQELSTVTEENNPEPTDNFGANGLLGTSGNDDGNGTGYVCTDSGCVGYGDLSGLE